MTRADARIEFNYIPSSPDVSIRSELFRQTKLIDDVTIGDEMMSIIVIVNQPIHFLNEKH